MLIINVILMEHAMYFCGRVPENTNNKEGETGFVKKKTF